MSEDRAISILVHGPTKVGKSTFSVTGPYPTLFMDVEKAARFLKGRKKRWNPLTESPPVHDGTWDICVVNVDSWEKATKSYEWLKGGKHPFRSVVLDSISELQAKAQEFVAGRNQMKTQDWGTLLSKMAFYCRDLRDLTTADNSQIEAVVITAMSREVDGVFKPYLQGQISALVSFWFDITGYLWVEQVADADGVVTDVRKLMTGKHPQFETGNRVPDLPYIIENPNVTGILNSIFGEVAPELPVM